MYSQIHWALRSGNAQQGSATLTEAFKPIAVRRASDNRALFWARCAVDLQLLTIYEFLCKPLSSAKGRLLDVGAGEAPWRDLMNSAVDYVAVDIDSSPEFGMQRQQEIQYYDGKRLPFADNSFDFILCTEVIEHVQKPDAFLDDLNRVLRHGGTLILTVPWSARVHHSPHDYNRFSRFGLESNLTSANFGEIVITERGNDVAAIANKLVVLTVRLLRSPNKYYALLSWLGALLVSPMAIFFVLLAHASFVLNFGSKDDPLGYGVVAKKMHPVSAE